jgi:hypothetical protein
MKNFFGVGAILIALLFGLCAYWYLNPSRAPSFLRGTLPEVNLRGPTVAYP